MPQHAVVVRKLFIGEFVRDEFAGSVGRILTFDSGKYFAERGGEFDQRLVLFSREIVLDEILALDVATNRSRSRGMAHKSRRANTPVAITLGERECGHAVGFRFIP